jgi:hypothetical protein
MPKRKIDVFFEISEVVALIVILAMLVMLAVWLVSLL